LGDPVGYMMRGNYLTKFYSLLCELLIHTLQRI
jgi:hypothetical protein